MKESTSTRAPRELNWAQLAALIEASNLLNATLDHDEVLRQLMTLVARGVDADRATLYLLDEAGRELRSIVLMEESLHEIRLPVEKGLAGYAARTGEIVNVPDAYADPRFNPQIDQQAGYRTRTILTVPMRDPQGRIIGVVQALNKRQGRFSPGDEYYLVALAEQAALALESARQHAAMAADCRHLYFLYQIGNQVAEADRSDQPGLGDLLRTTIEGVAEELEAEAASILLLNPGRQRLSFLVTTQGEEDGLAELQVPLEGSIAGWVVQHQQAVVVDDVQDDARFFPGVDASTGLVSRTLVCAPLKAWGETIGALEVLNKRGDGPFTQSDLHFARAVATYAALVLASRGAGEAQG